MNASKKKILRFIYILVIPIVIFLGNKILTYKDDMYNSREYGGISQIEENQSDKSIDNEYILTINKSINDVNGGYKVARVVDGDTYIININGVDKTVRLIGVDTPESVAKGEKAYKNCPEGKEASRYIKNLIDGNEVYLEYDVSRTDKYGRVLAYVYYEGVQLEEILLKKGYARTLTVPPNVQYANEYSRLQQIAIDNNAGFWSSNPYK